MESSHCLSILDLPVELQIEIFEHITGLKDQVSLIQAYPPWEKLLMNHLSLRRNRYAFIQNGTVGVHKLLYQSVGERLVCKIDSSAVSPDDVIQSYTYHFPSYFATPDDPTTEVCIPTGCRFLDEPLIFPGSSISLTVGPPPEPYPITSSVSSLIPRNVPLTPLHPRPTPFKRLICNSRKRKELERIMAPGDFIYDICTIPDCRCEHARTPTPLIRVKLPSDTEIPEPVPWEGLSIKGMVLEIARAVLMRKEVERDADGEPTTTAIDRPDVLALSLVGHHYSHWIEHLAISEGGGGGRRSTLCHAWVLTANCI
ncbi:hypothetical protein TWF481_006554 [Arthrobotrys musiformis]|uniref:F-box domain-containing protein n=1 Tax=Arthrobotrys musiformis TaxID=47236 RepID=A0AAV9W8U7_9PEZI